MKFFSLFTLFGFFILTGCSKFGYVYLNYPQPPQVYLPDSVRTIAIANRSLVTEADRESKAIETLATGEIAGSDVLASEECLKAVYDEFDGFQGVEIIFPKKIRLYGTGTRQTPDVLEWERVQNICDSAETDALLVLETFDSNSDLLLSAAKNQVSNLVSGNLPRPNLPGSAQVDVYSYWRMYDPDQQSIIDQYQHSSYMTFDLSGRALPPDALQRAAYQAGVEYVHRYMPSYYRVKRDLYKKAKGSVKHGFKSGFRKTEVANWQGAIETWSGLLEKAEPKTAGRICLNIAVAYEVLGDTKTALDWAQRSYEDYGDKLGRDYAKILLRRKSIEY